MVDDEVDAIDLSSRLSTVLDEIKDVMEQRKSRIQELRQEIEEVRMLRLLQQEVADQLQLGLSEVQSARVALSTAIAERTTCSTNLLKTLCARPF